MITRLKQRTYHYSTFDTSIGTCAVAWADAGIVAARLPEKTERLLVEKLQSYLRADLVENQAPPAVINRGIAAMRSHLDGKLNDLSSIVVDYDRVPPFHQKVYEAARKIPPGVTVSYGELARAAGSPGAARAVGQALARNPFAIVVPCHRIIAHNGGAGGFSAFGGCATKEKMLKIEGYVGGKKVKKETGMRFVPAEPGMLQFDPELAVQHLCKVDKKMAKLIAAVGPFRLHVDEMVPPFEALAQSIVYQQLTGKAAGTIFGRVKAIYKSDRLPHPKKILQTPDEQLRAAGLSTAKTAALKDLAAKQIAGVIPSLEELYELSDEEIIERLTSVRGVGRWTVEMLLMFRLGRPDVLPVADYGVRKGFALTYGRGDILPTPKELGVYGERWKPYRSVASWYLWRSLELGKKAKK